MTRGIRRRLLLLDFLPVCNKRKQSDAQMYEYVSVSDEDLTWHEGLIYNGECLKWNPLADVFLLL
jgi:hypothetical protein